VNVLEKESSLSNLESSMGLYVAIVLNTDTLEVRVSKAFHTTDCIECSAFRVLSRNITLQTAFRVLSRNIRLTGSASAMFSA